MEGGAIRRYQELGLSNTLSRTSYYPLACKELSFILRSHLFSQFPKGLQSLVFQDILTAFRLLPQIQTKAAVSSANVLVQSAEAILPKQKRVLAVTEFKHAMVVHKRKSKSHIPGEGLIQLPQDLLTLIFKYLDLNSLLSAASVCQSWNAATRDNLLWNFQYISFFNGFNRYPKAKETISIAQIKSEKHTQEDGINGVAIDWKDAFKKAYRRIPLKNRNSVRGYCRHCNAIVWLINTKCYKENTSKKHPTKPLSSQQIVEYILDDYRWLISSSDSDSDSDDEIVWKWWSYPKCRSCASL